MAVLERRPAQQHVGAFRTATGEQQFAPRKAQQPRQAGTGRFQHIPCRLAKGVRAGRIAGAGVHCRQHPLARRGVQRRGRIVIQIDRSCVLRPHDGILQGRCHAGAPLLGGDQVEMGALELPFVQ